MLVDLSNRIAVSPVTGCWLSLSVISTTGYGRRRINGKDTLLHRAALEATYGPLGNMNALHKCRQVACFNPSHLYAGTQKQNMADRKRDGTNCSGDQHYSKSRPELVCRGERQRHAKLTDGAVRLIRRMLADGIRDKDIAKHFGVSAGTINKIKHGRRWTHVLG